MPANPALPLFKSSASASHKLNKSRQVAFMIFFHDGSSAKTCKLHMERDGWHWDDLMASRDDRDRCPRKDNFLQLLQQVVISLTDVPAAPEKHGKRPLPKVQVLSAEPEVLKESGKINHFSGNRVGADLSRWPNNYHQLYLLPWPYLWRTTPTTVSMPVPESTWGKNAMKAIMCFLPPISTPQMHK